MFRGTRIQQFSAICCLFIPIVPNQPHTQRHVVRQIDAVEAERVIRIDQVQILDVRPTKEFRTL